MTDKNPAPFDSSDVARFWSKVNKRMKSQCWHWQASKRKSGYGNFQGPDGATYAHRFAYLITHGSIPDGAIIRHTCDKPSCCNPAHLVAGTHTDNVNDRVTRNRSAAGARNGRSKLTLEEARDIKYSTLTTSQLERKYRRVTERAIEMIRKGITWKSA